VRPGAAPGRVPPVLQDPGSPGLPPRTRDRGWRDRGLWRPAECRGLTRMCARWCGSGATAGPALRSGPAQKAQRPGPRPPPELRSTSRACRLRAGAATAGPAEREMLPTLPPQPPAAVGRLIAAVATRRMDRRPSRPSPTEGPRSRRPRPSRRGGPWTFSSRGQRRCPRPSIRCRSTTSSRRRRLTAVRSAMMPASQIRAPMTTRMTARISDWMWPAGEFPVV